MATTKIWPVKYRLDRLLKYILNSQKTEKLLYTTGINCTPQSALSEMNGTKKLFDKRGGIVGFHAYQSFSPGEVTPDLAHEIGCRLSHELWASRFQIVVATHLDRDHIHNHIAINSVSFIDGKRFHCSAKEYRHMRELSDKICAEYHLSVIENPQPGKTKHYAEWSAERKGKPTWRSIIKFDVDESINRALTDRQFFENLRACGYEIKQGKDIALRPAGKERFLRLARNFGDNYTHEAIVRRILQNTHAQTFISAKRSGDSPKNMPALPKGSITKLYHHYLYLFGFYKKRSSQGRMHFLLAEDIRAFDEIVYEAKLLDEHNLKTSADLGRYLQEVQGRIRLLCNERKCIRSHLRKSTSNNSETLDQRLGDITFQLRRDRAEVKHCSNIAKRSEVLREKIAHIEQEEEKIKEERWRKNGRNGPSHRSNSTHDARR